MRSAEKFRSYQKIDWDSLNTTTIIAITVEILILGVFTLFHEEGDFAMSYSFFNIWIVVSAVVNIALILILVTYRPRLWGVQLLVLTLLPLVPAWIAMNDFGYLLVGLVKALSK